MLKLENIGVSFHHPYIRVVEDISLSIEPGEALALVGESGSGKTTIGRVAVGLLKPENGEAYLDGRPFGAYRGELHRSWRRSLQMVFQDPDASLPRHLPVRRVLQDALALADLSREKSEPRLNDLLEEMELSAELLNRKPRELSGGERQRVALARAFAPLPRLVVLDEPTSAVDTMLKGRILKLLRGYQERHGTAFLLITHDMKVASALAGKVSILQNGRIVETGPPQTFLNAPDHPYTRRLVASLPSRDPDHKRIITGRVASANTEKGESCVNR